ncbi:hypothetical protein EDB80DRAFT_742142 [Ilyonectria destructans]|nr:hypothetical protein EDB80DRAFT_742142 [Ilyonectria destructans]
MARKEEPFVPQGSKTTRPKAPPRSQVLPSLLHYPVAPSPRPYTTVNMTINKAISQLLVRRLFEAINSYVFSSSEMVAHFDQNEGEPMPTWIALLLFGTLYLMAAVSISVSYTLGHVVNTLTMIEVSPKAIAVDNPLSGSEEDRNAKRLLVSAATLRTPKPITAHIQTTIQHLRAAAGFWSLWRGWRFAIIYSVVAKAIQIVVNPVLGHAQTPCGPYGFFPFVAVILTAILTSGVTGAGVWWTGFSVAQRPCGSAHFGAKLAPKSKVTPPHGPFAFARKTPYKRAQPQKKGDKTEGQLTCLCMRSPSKMAANNPPKSRRSPPPSSTLIALQLRHNHDPPRPG